MGIKVYLLDNGTLALDKSFVTWNHGQGTEVRFPVYAVFIDHPDGKILLDTGFDKEWVERKLPFEKPGQSDEQRIENQLAAIGVQTDAVDIVVNSHLHFDHCSNNKLFPRARFIMTKAELRHAFVPDPWERLGYDRDLVDMPGANLTLLEPLGDATYEVVPGVTLFETPGHSAGHLSAIVRPDGDVPMVFPIDVAWFRENLERRVLMGLHSDPLDLLRSMQRVENEALRIGGRIFYSHDPQEYASYKKGPDFYGN